MSKPFIGRGDKGEEVTEIQQRLVAWGYLAVRADGSPAAKAGVFDAATELAASSFQAWNRVWPSADLQTVSLNTGKIDPDTMKALLREPQLTKAGVPKLPGEVSLGTLSSQGLCDYLWRQLELFSGSVPLNRDPGGINFVQVRGLDPEELTAIQNLPNAYNDPIFALVNADNCQPGDCLPEPSRLQVLKATADYGYFSQLIASGYGYSRPAWLTQKVHPTLGDEGYQSMGLVVVAPSRVMSLALGQHITGPERTPRGIGLIDPLDDADRDELGDARMHGYVDFNHNRQIDGLEYSYAVGLSRQNDQVPLQINPFTGELEKASSGQLNRIGSNVHRGGDTEPVGWWSAGCLAIRADGDYQKFNKLLFESGQVRSYIESLGKDAQAQMRTLRGWRRTWATTDGYLTYENADVPYIDNRYTTEENPYQGAVFMGFYQTISQIRFPFLLLDSRDLAQVDPTQRDVCGDQGQPCCAVNRCQDGLSCQEDACVGPDGIEPWSFCDPDQDKCRYPSVCCPCSRIQPGDSGAMDLCSDPINGFTCRIICINL